GLALTLFAGPFVLDERWGLELLYELRGVREAPSFLTIIRMSEATARRAGQPAELTKWRRSAHGQLVDRVAADGPAAIVFDVFFEDDSSDPREDESFAAAIERAGNVLLVKHLVEPEPGSPPQYKPFRKPPIEPLERA